MKEAQTTQEALNAALKEAQAWKAAALAVNAERDALAAQVEVLTSHRRELLDLIYNNAIGAIAMGCAVDIERMAENAFSITGIDATKNRKEETTLPNCFLNEIRAEAVIGFANFVYAQFENGEYHQAARIKYRQINSRPQGQTVSIHNDIEYCGILANAEKYAEQIRQGGKK